MKSYRLLLVCVFLSLSYSYTIGCNIISFSPLTGVCPGATVTISGIFATTGSTTPAVSWNGSNCSVQSYSSSSITITLAAGATGNSVTVRDKSNSLCTGNYAGIVYSAPPDLSSVTATLTTINSGQSTTLFANGAVIPTAWYKGNCSGTSIASGISLTVSPSTTTTYCARNESIMGGCGSACKCITITVISMPTAISEQAGNSGNLISIYPNPLTSSSYLQLNEKIKDAEVSVYDMLGKEILKQKLNGSRMEIEKGSWERGIYLVRVSAQEGRWVEKLVVE